MLYTKIAIVAILGAILFSGGFIGGIFTQNYLKILPPQNPPSTQPPPQTTGENLTIQSHALLVFSKQAIQFNLKNTGTTNIQVADVKMNGYSNQTPPSYTQGTIPGWNGTTALQPNQTGPLYVYLACYYQAINESIPSSAFQDPSNQTQQEELDLWVNSFNCTFTFITTAQKQYDYTVPAQGNMIAALMWMGTLTFTFMATEQVQITNVQFGGADVNKYVVIMARNTGTDTITISEVQINGVKQNMITPPLPQTISANAELALNVTYTWITGCNYDFKLLTSKGNQFQYMASAPAI